MAGVAALVKARARRIDVRDHRRRATLRRHRGRGRLRDALGVAPAGLAAAVPRHAGGGRARAASSPATRGRTGRSCSSDRRPRASASRPMARARGRAAVRGARWSRGLPAGGTTRELCDRDVLDALRRKSLARLRRAIEPVSAAALARFLPEWQGVPRSAADATRCSRWWRSSPAVRWSPRRSSRNPAGAHRRLPQRGTSTRSAARARSCGPGLEPLGASDGRIALFLAERRGPAARTPAHAGGGAAGRQHPRVPARRAGRRLLRGRRARRRAASPATCSTRSGRWSGRARSPTTRSSLCAAGPSRRPASAATPAPRLLARRARDLPAARAAGLFARRAGPRPPPTPTGARPSRAACSTATAW